MSFYLFLARSITHAQEMAKVLEQSGIYTKVRYDRARLRI